MGPANVITGSSTLDLLLNSRTGQPSANPMDFSRRGHKRQVLEDEKLAKALQAEWDRIPLHADATQWDDYLVSSGPEVPRESQSMQLDGPLQRNASLDQVYNRDLINFQNQLASICCKKCQTLIPTDWASIVTRTKRMIKHEGRI